MVRILLCFFAAAFISCSNSELEHIEPNEPNLNRVSNSDITGVWNYDYEVNPVLNGQYASSTIVIKAISESEITINGDTVNLINASTYSGNPLISGSLFGNKLTHCELYNDGFNSYYACVDYYR